MLVVRQCRYRFLHIEECDARLGVAAEEVAVFIRNRMRMPSGLTMGENHTTFFARQFDAIFGQRTDGLNEDIALAVKNLSGFGFHGRWFLFEKRFQPACLAQEFVHLSLDLATTGGNTTQDLFCHVIFKPWLHSRCFLSANHA